MVARRTGGDEHIVGGAGKDVVHRRHRTADAGQRRLQAFGTGIGIGFELVDPVLFLRNFPHHGFEMFLRMRQQHRIRARFRRLPALQPLEIRMFERDIDGADPVRSLRMTSGRHMFQKDRMLIKTGAHGDTLSVAYVMFHSRWGIARRFQQARLRPISSPPAL